MLEKRMCDECGKRPAVYYMKKTLNGVTTERYLCEECRNKMGFLQPDMSDFGNMLAAFGNPFFGIEAPK